jgi:hypothetical protein
MSRDREHGAVYEIRLRGWLHEGWSRWFDGMSIEHSCEAAGLTTTKPTGTIANQAALHGALERIWNLNLVLFSVRRAEMESQQAEPGRQIGARRGIPPSSDGP